MCYYQQWVPVQGQRGRPVGVLDTAEIGELLRAGDTCIVRTLQRLGRARWRITSRTIGIGRHSAGPGASRPRCRPYRRTPAEASCSTATLGWCTSFRACLQTTAAPAPTNRYASGSRRTRRTDYSGTSAVATGAPILASRLVNRRKRLTSAKTQAFSVGIHPEL